MFLSFTHPLLVNFNFELDSTEQRFEYLRASRRFEYVLGAGFAGVYFQRIYLVKYFTSNYQVLRNICNSRTIIMTYLFNIPSSYGCWSIRLELRYMPNIIIRRKLKTNLTFKKIVYCCIGNPRDQLRNTSRWRNYLKNRFDFTAPCSLCWIHVSQI